MKVRTVHCFCRNRMSFWSNTPWLLILFFMNISQNFCYRLPKSIIPEKYDLKIITHLDEGTENDFQFCGRVKIKVHCLTPTNNITLNFKDLEINSTKTRVTQFKRPDLSISNQESDPKNDFHIIHLNSQLEPDAKYEITLEFKGKLTDGLLGYYRSSYEDSETGEKHWLATTQFEPTDARRAFPCFDEPSMKAKFKITLGHHNRYSSLSNMPLEMTKNVKDRNDWVWDVYQESVKMSTYLVAFIITDFGNVESSKEFSKTSFRTWARKNALNQACFVKEVGPKSLTFFEKYFEIEYPLPKQDMIAIPDFSSGAMENWGLITYRETALLLDDNVAAANNKYRIASVVAHELAHQWFGNLVTMKWWTDLWLNEGFATYMAALAVDHLFPEWNSLDGDAVKNILQVYNLDSLETSHPVSVPIKNPSEINEIFDVISYKKGSFIIRMMDLFLGEDVLRKGVRNYLNKHAYGNAEQDDLWDALTKQAQQEKTLPENVTVKLIMDTWTLQTGYPLITVERDYYNNTAIIKQERFFKKDDDNKKQDDNACWWVPLSYTTQSELDFKTVMPKLWLSCPKENQIIDGPSSTEWIIFNIKASGLYRINYDEKNWKLLTNHLKNNDLNDISPINRVLLIDNAMELASSGDLPYSIAFNLISYIQNDTAPLPWRTALGKLSGISNKLSRTSSFGLIKKYIKNLVEPMYERVGALKVSDKKRKSLEEIRHQVLLAGTSCACDVSKCISEAVDLFQNFMKNPEEPNTIPQDMRLLVYCQGVKHGNEEEWNFLWKQYVKSNVATEKSSILSALACTEKVWLLTRFLDWSIKNGSSIRNQDTFSVFNSVSASSVGFYVAKSFFENNVQNIFNRIGSKKYRMGQFVKSIAYALETDQESEQFSKFLQENMRYFDKASIAVNQSLEAIQINIQWHKKHYKNVQTILMNELDKMKSVS